ncbi:hypothetical protein ACFXGA_06310 [Actinosynnema sp. NPDC059335]|uniref:hypothetical protein n=1 Tax=Actinosynnema sp. NPDC059335 TaxID=3346804 RepID=UPI00366E6996
MTTPQPRRVVLCGSLNRHNDLLIAAARHYRAHGDQVHVPERDITRSAAEHARRWYRLIDNADLVVIVTDPSGYLGDQTTREKQHAEQRGVPVVVERWLPATRAPISGDLVSWPAIYAAAGRAYEAWAAEITPTPEPWNDYVQRVPRASLRWIKVALAALADPANPDSERLTALADLAGIATGEGVQR